MCSSWYLGISIDGTRVTYSVVCMSLMCQLNGSVQHLQDRKLVE